MYIDTNLDWDENRQFAISNEINFSNLFSAVNNPEIFEHLDRETQQRLIQVLCAYTKACVDKILSGTYSEARSIKSGVEKMQNQVGSKSLK